MAALLTVLLIALAFALLAWFVYAHTVDLQAPKPPSAQAAAPLLIARPAPPLPIAAMPKSARAAVTVKPAVPLVIEAPKLLPWQEKGWKETREGGLLIYEGYYTITDAKTGRKRSFRGKIKVQGVLARPYIADPPLEFFRNHPKATCLREWHEKPWFWLNWARPTASVDKAILYMERILDEGVNPSLS